MLAHGFSEEDKSFDADDNEDKPLLSKNITDRRMCDITLSNGDVCTAAVNGTQISEDRTLKLRYNSTECSIKPAACASINLPATASDTNHTLTSSIASPMSPEIASERVEPPEHVMISSGYEGREGPTLKLKEPETFELNITDTCIEDTTKQCAMFRSLSSMENCRYSHIYEKENPHFQVFQQRRFKLGNKRLAMSRSQSQPLAKDEEEYSKYWRGEVTVIEMPTTEIAQSRSELKMDDKMAATAITRAILMGNNRLVLECLKQGENPHITCRKTGRSYLHIVAIKATADKELQWVPVVYQLSNAGVDVDIKDTEGQTAVRIAIKRRLVQILAALLKCGAEFSAADEYHADQAAGVVKAEMMDVIRRLTPGYWWAIDNFTHSKVNRLIKAWSRVNISRNGQTLIEYAKQNAGDMSVVRSLVQNEASIELAHAVMAGDAERVRVILCDSAANMATTDSSVRSNFVPLTLFEAAILYRHDNILSVLKEISKTKPSAIVKVDSHTDCKSPSGERGPSSPSYFQKKAEAGSISNLSNTIDYGSSNSIEDTDLVTSTMCAIL
ncbi:hypothetical protein BsWGS_12934 [Bradybaena similaris]